jgi:hypothetical protein
MMTVIKKIEYIDPKIMPLLIGKDILEKDSFKLTIINTLDITIYKYCFKV